jgi:hypothetical protein
MRLRRFPTQQVQNAAVAVVERVQGIAVLNQQAEALQQARVPVRARLAIHASLPEGLAEYMQGVHAVVVLRDQLGHRHPLHQRAHYLRLRKRTRHVQWGVPKATCHLPGALAEQQLDCVRVAQSARRVEGRCSVKGRGIDRHPAAGKKGVCNYSGT